MTDTEPRDRGTKTDHATPPAGYPPRAYAALRCALAHMRLRCEQLTYALAARNASRAESLAQDCVHYWLVAAAALRRLERDSEGHNERDSEGHDDDCRSARYAVSRTARLLLTLLDCGVDETAEPTSSGFAQLRLSLALAAASRTGDPAVHRPELPARSSVARAVVVPQAARSRARR